ncbi:secreted RxLR effector protein 161-like [Cannabis sativa]|uniref:secreted RxLR effector protein 161-like n=1 Tax=Cannabis sativa TaxID=3483 RepID=UPI0029C9BAA9|nr:secreted RxLR effector protein 161-like [Cannabis sativa]
MCPKTKLEQEDMANVPYSNAVGSIMYLMVSTRPDLAYAISVLSKFMSSLGKEHWKAMKWLMRYLKGTSKLGLVYQGHQTHQNIEGFTDADYAGDRDTRRSTSTYFFLTGGNCTSWKVQLQPVVALSTTQSEYIATTETIKEALCFS